MAALEGMVAQLENRVHVAQHRSGEEAEQERQKLKKAEDGQGISCGLSVCSIPVHVSGSSVMLLHIHNQSHFHSLYRQR